MLFCQKFTHRLAFVILIGLLTAMPANAQFAVRATGWIEVVKSDAVSYANPAASTSDTFFILRTANPSEPDYLLTADRKAGGLNFDSGPDHVFTISGVLVDVPAKLKSEVHFLNSTSDQQQQKRKVSSMIIVQSMVAAAATAAPAAAPTTHGRGRVACDVDWPAQHKPDSEYQAYIKSCMAGAEVAPTSAAQASAAQREIVVVYVGDRNPGAGWTASAMNVRQYERRFTVNADVSTTAFPGWPARQGARFYSLSLSQLGTLPEGKLYIGPADKWGIETGASVASMATSSGMMGMFVVEPSQTVVRWVER